MTPNDFDYEVIAKCNWGVPDSHSSPEGISDCGEPALYRGWWDDGVKMPLCQVHLGLILEEGDETS